MQQNNYFGLNQGSELASALEQITGANATDYIDKIIGVNVSSDRPAELKETLQLAMATSPLIRNGVNSSHILVSNQLDAYEPRLQTSAYSIDEFVADGTLDTADIEALNAAQTLAELPNFREGQGYDTWTNGMVNSWAHLIKIWDININQNDERDAIVSQYGVGVERWEMMKTLKETYRTIIIPTNEKATQDEIALFDAKMAVLRSLAENLPELNKRLSAIERVIGFTLEQWARISGNKDVHLYGQIDFF